MTKNKINILCVLPVVGQPRYSKRIKMLINSGYENVKAIAFERDYFKGREPECSLEVLGKIEHGNYFSRLVRFAKILPKLRRHLRNIDVVYVFGFDMLVLSFLSGLGLKNVLILEVGDIRKIQINKGLKGKIFRIVEVFFLNKCSLLVCTSSLFVSEYYRKWIKSNVKSLVIENKLDHNPDNKNLHKNIDDKITIGYFGFLRCKWSIDVLKSLAVSYPDKFNIVFAGYSGKPLDLDDEIKNIKFLGEYKSPTDLPHLYGSVDIVWACYPFPDEDDWNWKWARTNRYYESLFYKKPMFVLEGSGDSFSVLDRKIGIIVNRESINETVNKIAHIGKDEIEGITINVLKLPDEVYSYTDENYKLNKAINRIKK
jgi:succinoglycan biosynthesis protein ExoL